MKQLQHRLFPHRTDRSADPPPHSAGSWTSIFRLLPVFLLLFALVSCQSPEQKAQAQYDLGVRYLSEGNYESAVLAFTAAIEIDPNRADAYVGRGQALMQMELTEETLASAQADFEKALELDGSLADAWLGLSDVHLARNDTDAALAALQQGLDATGDSRIQDALQQQQGELQPEPAEISFETVPDPNNPAQSFSTITAYDESHQQLWQYQTATVQMAQIDVNTSLGQHGDRYYIQEEQHIVALDVRDGSVVWKNPETFTGPSVAFADDCICVSTIMTPQFAAISYDGTTLKTIDSLDPGAYWEGYISQAGSTTTVSGDEATITVSDASDSRQFLYYVDLNTFEVRKGQDTPVAQVPETAEPTTPDTEPAPPDTEPTTPEPETTPDPTTQEPAPAPQPTGAAWKQAYLDYYNANEGTLVSNTTKFALIDLDQNGIPELYIEGMSRADGGRLYTWSEAGVSSTNISIDGNGYLPGQNMFRTFFMTRGYSSDTIYSVQNGQIVQTHIGENMGGDYTLDGAAAGSESDYQAQFNAIYDTSKESAPGPMMSYDELIQAMESY